MVGGNIFSETQGPKDLQNRSEPRQSLVTRRIGECQPMSNTRERLAQKGSRWLRGIQAMGPATKRGGIGHSVRVFERRRRLFPGAVLHSTPPPCLTTCQQAVAGVRERKPRQEGEGLPATGAATATDANPVVMLIMRLLAAVSVTDDRIAFTNGASPQNGLATACGPIGFELVRRNRKWDKENRSSLEPCPDVDLPRSEPEAELLPLKRKCQLEENNASRLQFLKSVIQRIGR
jgi:hypothetical protein